LRADEPLPQPDAAAQAKAEKLIKGLFREDYLRSRLVDRLALAQKLWDQAVDTKDDPVARFVLLREARDVAAKAGDVAGGFKAAQEMAKRYAVRPAEGKAIVVELARRSTVAKLGAADTVKVALPVIKEATDDDDYASAGRLLKLAAAAAPLAKSVPLIAQVQTRAKEVEQLQKDFERVQPDLATLQKAPDDGGANARVGKYWCVHKGKWAKGLPLLVKGDDDKWKAQARLDLGQPTGAPEQLKVADGWWELAEGIEARLQAQPRLRAAHWYKQAVPELAGLSRTRADKRLEEVKLLSEADTKQLVTAKDLPKTPAEGVVGPGERLASKFIGKYRMTFTGAGRGTTTWVMKANHRAVENGKEMGTWNADKSQIVLIYDQPALGRVVLQFKDNDTWVGTHRQRNGQVFNWVLKRLDGAD
jgi:hypothetical protein